MTHATKTRKPQAQKEATILVRYLVKASGVVCCRVRNAENTIYTVCIQKNGRISCDCEAHTTCYHIKAVQAAEDNRTKKAAAVVVSQPKPAQPVTLPQHRNEHATVPLYQARFGLPPTWKELEALHEKEVA